MLLQVVTFARDVRSNFHTVAETDTSNLSKSRVRLLRGYGTNLQANTAFLRAALFKLDLLARERVKRVSKRRRLWLSPLLLARVAHELIDRGQNLLQKISHKKSGPNREFSDHEEQVYELPDRQVNVNPHQNRGNALESANTPLKGCENQHKLITLFTSSEI